ncbi:MAG TPA: nicotinate phosphoribosyltransferase [Spirochaetia bacterium]|nr:nicotinate phosphoribosyltransferase [Spirochaetia bacterium]
MNVSLLTDFYELSMMQGYFLHKENPRVVFDMFFRRQPFGGGFSVFAGLETALDLIGSLAFSPEDLAYLDSLGVFHKEFLHYLEDFRFRGDVWSMEEGTLAFPGEPIVRVHGTLMEAQLIESVLLAVLNFQTLIATKAARIRLAANGGAIIEFGLRRAQGIDGALSASRAAFIGGAVASSNTLAGKRFGIPVRGTMAHSWIMAFANELEAFEKYGEIYPDGAILLIDTYDTLGSGIENAIAVGKKLKKAGHRNFGVRLDSGDLEYLSKIVRARLDQAGLSDASIVASNELDEHIIHQLITQGAPIDSWGVGTNLVTGGGDSALTGVYKIAAKQVGGEWLPTIKVSNNPEKVTNPGIKQIWRFSNGGGSPLADLICLEGEQAVPGKAYTFHHPMGDYRSFTLSNYAHLTPLLGLRMKEGNIVGDLPNIAAIQTRARSELDRLDDTYKRLINPHVYKVSLSDDLGELKFRLIRESLSRGAHG